MSIISFGGFIATLLIGMCKNGVIAVILAQGLGGGFSLRSVSPEDLGPRESMEKPVF